ncbi:peptidoglycan DD-metalloendopeptidase family protein [Bacillus tianshenii]|uniref:murein hydrolase activator EnvC family protein n=1 Tax=Sutcliffiella tianshenii TaxID=1463404 RepID=UPI001CD23348|nr:peptidoglycan DD-metalloendopeptidase family protein [Bacillus tianshenii]MCA1322179.1 peptidoglycan DD-metalloendopeptidase family protein [Bacillus tianshenii]
MRRKIGTVAIAAVIGFSGFFSTGLTDTASANLKEKLNDVQNEQSNNESTRSGKQDEVNQLQAEQKTLEEEVKQLDLAVGETTAKISAKKEEIDGTRQDITKLQEEIVVLKERIEKRNELLKDRARSFQQGGGAVNYLDVLLGAQSFGDFIDRVGAVATIVQADRDILKAHQEDLQLLEDKELELKETLASLEQQLTELEAMEAQLRQQIKEKDALMAQLKKKEQETMVEIHELENEAQILAAQEKAIRAEIQAAEERARKEAEERARIEAENARKAEEARRAAEEAKAAGKPAPPAHVSSPPPVSSGSWTRPATGSVTSGYGGRWGGSHYGVDIGKNGRSGDVPVVAAASGTVFQSYYSSSYGNVVFITHYIDGQTFTSVYAHLERPGVPAGTSVSKGQQIGVMGNTGYSFGAHLHFELHKGSWNGSKSNAVNPANYINF